MFKMRREQMAAFREDALRGFEDRVAAHVQRCFARRWSALQEDGVRGLIRRGVERAAAHGIVAERDVCLFIDLMLVFGAGFDREQAWAREILEAPALDPSAKTRALYAHGMEEA